MGKRILLFLLTNIAIMVTLSIVLSKAFLLAADDTIKDPTIVRQIAPRR